MRLIDADEVIKSLKRQNELLKLLPNKYDELIDITNIICVGFKQEIDNAPTIDAVPVVRCKDCKLHDPDTFPIKSGHPCSRVGLEPNDFCSWAEKIDEVIRCKDCRNFHEVDKSGFGRCYEHDSYDKDGDYWYMNDFCSYGERRTDWVEVVRCRDCKYMTEHYDTDGNVPYWTCSEWDAGTDYDGYCHYGERREE